MMFESIFKALEKRRVKYLVIGGIAVNFHGYNRVTGDLDLLVGLDEENLKKFIEAVKSLGWRPRLPVSLEDFTDSEKRKSWIKEKGMKVFSIYNPKKEAEHVDIMTETYLDFDKAYKNKKMISANNIKISLVSIPDLIRLKKIAGRGRDKIDIMALKKIQELNRE